VWNPVDRTVSHGPAVKYVSAVDDRFWEAEGLAPMALWDGLGSLWEGTDQQPQSAGGYALGVFSGGPLVLPEASPAQVAALYPAIGPSDTRFVDWTAEPFIGTGYSIPAPGEVTTVAPLLTQPFAGRLFLAGEQASPGFFGHMEGALRSGAAAARVPSCAPLPRSSAGPGPRPKQGPASAVPGATTPLDPPPATPGVSG